MKLYKFEKKKIRFSNLREVDDVPALRHVVGDIFCSLDPTKLHQTLARLVEVVQRIMRIRTIRTRIMQRMAMR